MSLERDDLDEDDSLLQELRLYRIVEEVGMGSNNRGQRSMTHCYKS